MKRSVILAGLISLFLSGCLGFRSIAYQLEFDDSFNKGKIKVTFEDIRSEELIIPDFNIFSEKKEKKSESEEEKAQRIKQAKKDDFKELLDTYQSDDMLLDMVKQGIYIKDRFLYEKNGKLYGGFNGIFQNLKFDEDDFILNVLQDSVQLIVSSDNETERIETNGAKKQDETGTIITWPKTQRTLYWRVVLKTENPEKSHSLVDLYREWKKKS